MTILVVDEDQKERESFNAALNGDGYRDVIGFGAASDIYQFLALSSPDAPPTVVDLILLAMILPDGNGIEACAKIRRDHRYADVPIIMTTALNDLESAREAIESGATEYFTRPLSSVDLLACVYSKLRKKTPSSYQRERNIHIELDLLF